VRKTYDDDMKRHKTFGKSHKVVNASFASSPFDEWKYATLLWD
jgi:hypothetical protein